MGASSRPNRPSRTMIEGGRVLDHRRHSLNGRTRPCTAKGFRTPPTQGLKKTLGQHDVMREGEQPQLTNKKNNVVSVESRKRRIFRRLRNCFRLRKKINSNEKLETPEAIKTNRKTAFQRFQDIFKKKSKKKEVKEVQKTESEESLEDMVNQDKRVKETILNRFGNCLGCIDVNVIDCNNNSLTIEGKKITLCENDGEKKKPKTDYVVQNLQDLLNDDVTTGQSSSVYALTKAEGEMLAQKCRKPTLILYERPQQKPVNDVHGTTLIQQAPPRKLPPIKHNGRRKSEEKKCVMFEINNYDEFDEGTNHAKKPREPSARMRKPRATLEELSEKQEKATTNRLLKQEEKLRPISARKERLQKRRLDFEAMEAERKRAQMEHLTKKTETSQNTVEEMKKLKEEKLAMQKARRNSVKERQEKLEQNKTSKQRFDLQESLSSSHQRRNEKKDSRVQILKLKHREVELRRRSASRCSTPHNTPAPEQSKQSANLLAFDDLPIRPATPLIYQGDFDEHTNPMTVSQANEITQDVDVTEAPLFADDNHSDNDDVALFHKLPTHQLTNEPVEHDATKYVANNNNNSNDTITEIDCTAKSLVANALNVVDLEFADLFSPTNSEHSEVSISTELCDNNTPVQSTQITPKNTDTPSEVVENVQTSDKSVPGNSSKYAYREPTKEEIEKQEYLERYRRLTGEDPDFNNPVIQYVMNKGTAVRKAEYLAYLERKRSYDSAHERKRSYDSAYGSKGRATLPPDNQLKTTIESNKSTDVDDVFYVQKPGVQNNYVFSNTAIKDGNNGNDGFGFGDDDVTDDGNDDVTVKSDGGFWKDNDHDDVSENRVLNELRGVLQVGCSSSHSSNDQNYTRDGMHFL